MHDKCVGRVDLSGFIREQHHMDRGVVITTVTHAPAPFDK